MGEYISRENITERLERVIEHGVPNTMGTHSITAEATLEVIREIPAADVVEVVRCRECKHHDGIRCFCWNSVIVTRFDDYCSNGERKDGGRDDV